MNIQPTFVNSITATTAKKPPLTLSPVIDTVDFSGKKGGTKLVKNPPQATKNNTKGVSVGQTKEFNGIEYKLVRVTPTKGKPYHAWRRA